MNNTCKVEAGNLNILYIGVEQFQKIVRRARLVRVLHTDAEFIRVGRRQIESQAVVVAHRLNQFEQVNHVHTENILCGAKICLKTVAVEAQIDKHCVSLIDRNYLHALAVKLKIRLSENLLQCFDQCPEGSALNGFYFEEISVLVLPCY